MCKISVLLVDDHGLVRKGFRRVLEDDPEIRVVDEAANGEEAVRLARHLHPRVIVMDMAMPGLDGVQATREIVKHQPDIAVLILSMYSGENNKAKVTMRKSYGFRTFRTLELALYHSLGKLPEPESTHDFF